MSGRIVVLISGSGSNMEALAAACESGEVPGRIVSVEADRDCEGLKVADELGIPNGAVLPEGFADREAWNGALLDHVAVFEPDLVVSAGFMRILAPAFVDAFADRLINLHPALLPAFPGAHAVRDALSAGVRVTGSTVHFVDHEVDHGPILLQESVVVKQDDDEASLHERIKSVEHRLLPAACRLILEGRVRVSDGRTIVDES